MRGPSAFLLFSCPVWTLASCVFPLRYVPESWATGVTSVNHGPVTSREPLYLAFKFLVFRDPLVMRDGRRQSTACVMLPLCARCCHLELHVVCRNRKKKKNAELHPPCTPGSLRVSTWICRVGQVHPKPLSLAHGLGTRHLDL